MADIAFHDFGELEVDSYLFLVVTLELGVEHLGNGEAPFDSPRDVVDVLWFYERLEIILEHLGEVVLQFGTTEVLENFLPVGRILGLCMRRNDDGKEDVQHTS